MLSKAVPLSYTTPHTHFSAPTPLLAMSPLLMRELPAAPAKSQEWRQHAQCLLTGCGGLCILTANGPQPGDDAGAGRRAGPVGSFPLVQGGRGLHGDLVFKS